MARIETVMVRAGSDGSVQVVLVDSDGDYHSSIGERGANFHFNSNGANVVLLNGTPCIEEDYGFDGWVMDIDED